MSVFSSSLVLSFRQKRVFSGPGGRTGDQKDGLRGRGLDLGARGSLPPIPLVPTYGPTGGVSYMTHSSFPSSAFCMKLPPLTGPKRQLHRARAGSW